MLEKKNEKLVFHPIPMYMEKLYDIILQITIF